MRPTNSKKNEEDKKKAKSRDSLLEPSPLETCNVEATVLLLQCKNRDILITAIKELSKYVNSSPNNIKVLLGYDVVKSIIPIIEHEDIFVRRFAAKLLVEMITELDVATYVIEKICLTYFVKLLMNEEDLVMQEYASVILAKLSQDPYVIVCLAKYCWCMDFLFDKIESSDPDIKLNSMQILCNLMRDPVNAHEIANSKKFHFPLFLQHFKSSYPEIQRLALNIVALIIERSKTEHIYLSFRAANGIEILFNILENNTRKDLDIEALRILGLVVENPEILDDLIRSDVSCGIPRIIYYMKYTNRELLAKVLKVVVQIANIEEGRNVILHDIVALQKCGIVAHLANTLSTQQPDIIKISCHGIGQMALYKSAAEEFAILGFVEIILGLLKKEDSQSSTIEAACFALKRLLESDIKNCEDFLRLNGQDCLLQLMGQWVKRSETFPIEACEIIVGILIIIAMHLALRHFLINFNTVNITLSLLEMVNEFDELKIACCSLLSLLCLSKDGKRYFLEANGSERFGDLIADVHSIPIRESAINFIQTISTDSLVANAFIKSKYFPNMCNDRSSARMISSWDTCIKTLLKSNLSVKFALTGRLSLDDVIEDGFYVLREPVRPFPVLDDIFQLKCSPLKSIYVVNCTRSSPAQQNKAVFESNIRMNSELTFGRLQSDPYLIGHIERFKSIFQATGLETELEKDSFSTSRYVKHAKMLALYVARQLSGADPENACLNHQLEVHLKEIKRCTGTSVIPLGLLRVGSYLERALLFKVIADRLQLPAALVRGESGITWIEIRCLIKRSNETSLSDVLLYQSDEDYSEITYTDTLSKVSNHLNHAYLRRNYEKADITSSKGQQIETYLTNITRRFIVDLMDSPGDLIPIENRRPALYHNTELTCKGACCV